MITDIKSSNCALPVATPDGEFLAWYSEKGLCALRFPSTAKHSKQTGPVPAKIRRWHAATNAALKSALTGQNGKALPPLDLSAGTEFQRRVWGALRKIARGRTQSYAEVAKAVGRPKAVRAVGGACGANPIPVFIPCHRVVAANKRLGGFSGGLDWKRALLKREGIRLPD